MYSLPIKSALLVWLFVSFPAHATDFCRDLPDQIAGRPCAALAAEASVYHPDAASGPIAAGNRLALQVAEEDGLITPAGLEASLWRVPYRAALDRAVAGFLPPGQPFAVLLAQRTRYGDVSGQIVTANGVWLQRAVLAAGLVRYTGGVGDSALHAALLAAEAGARNAGHGIWAESRYAPLAAGRPEEIESGFQLVEGRVLDVARIGERVYLNFGPDWRTDFTAEVSRLDGINEGGATMPLTALNDRMVRLRGIVRRYAGPFMTIADSDQVEILDTR